MRGLLVTFIIGALLCSMLAVANAKSLRLNVTEALADCPTSGSKSCDFMDPKYWEEKAAPADGDDVSIIGANAFLELSTPLRLANLTIRWPNPTNSFVLFAVNTNFTTDTLNQAGFVSIVNGSLTASIMEDMSDVFAFRGTVTFMDFATESLFLDNGKFTAGKLSLKRTLAVTPIAELRCTSISSGHTLAVGGNVFVSSTIDVSATVTLQRDSLVHIWGHLVADQVTIGDMHMVWMQSAVEVRSFVINGFVVDFIIDGSANFTSNSNLTIFGSHVERFTLGGNIMAPHVIIQYANGAITDDDLIIHGNVNIFGTTLDLGGSISINGDLSLNGDLILLVTYLPEFPGMVYHPIVHVAGTLDRAEFSLGFTMDNFVVPPQNYSRFVRMGAAGDMSNFNITAPAMTTIEIGKIDISFRPVINSPTNSPNGGDNTTTDDLSKGEIGLIVVTVILSIIIIGLIVVIVKKGKANYQQIK